MSVGAQDLVIFFTKRTIFSSYLWAVNSCMLLKIIPVFLRKFCSLLNRIYDTSFRWTVFAEYLWLVGLQEKQVLCIYVYTECFKPFWPHPFLQRLILTGQTSPVINRNFFLFLLGYGRTVCVCFLWFFLALSSDFSSWFMFWL